MRTTLLLLITLGLTAHVRGAPIAADAVIHNVTIYDGTGKPGKLGDLAIRGDRIVGVGKFQVSNRPLVIDGTGLWATPGYIDLHTHCDTGSQGISTLKGHKNRNYLWQGLTTAVTGNCGSGPSDVAAYYSRMDKIGIGTNVIHLVPHNSVRREVMGNANRPPTEDELNRMKEMVDQGMKDGAYGMSTGLIYNPGTYAETAELIELAKVVSEHGGIYASHIRNESTGLLSAVEEALKIGQEADLPIHISHMKSSGKKAWGLCADAIALVQEAREQGQKVTADQYPYFASSTSLQATLVPARFREGSRDEYQKRLDDPDLGPRIRKAIEETLADDGGQRIIIAGYRHDPSWNGLRLGQAAEKAGKSVLDTVLDIERNGGAQIVHFSMREDDIRLIMKQPFVATASDGGVHFPGNTFPHPRSYGTFPRKIRHYAMDEKILPVEQAIRSASGLPADILGLTDRGYLKTGYFADIVVFDPKTYRDKATFENPHQLAEGIRWLVINGVAVISNGKELNLYPGRAIRKVKS